MASYGYEFRSSMPVANPRSNSNSPPGRILQVTAQRNDPDMDSDSRPVTSSTLAGSETGYSTPSSSGSSQRTQIRIDESALEPRRRSPNYDARAYEVLNSKKKKSGGVFGFLTLKEPSTSALAEFAEAEKEKERAKQKSGRAQTVGLSGVSTQKLPDYVPKVNSKWDGLPDSAKNRNLDRRNRSSVFSTSTRQSVQTANSSNSNGSSELRKPFTLTPNDEIRQSTRLSSPRQPPALALDLDVRPAVEETDDNKPQTFLHPPSPADQLQNMIPELPASNTPTAKELESSDFVQPQELDALSSGNSSPAALSPLTPPVEDEGHGPMLVGDHYPELASPTQIAAVDRNSTFLNSDTENEDVVVKPAAPRKRSPINFSRPRLRKPTPLAIPDDPVSPIEEPQRKPAPLSISKDPISPIEEPQLKPGERTNVNLLPTLNNSSGRLDPFLTDTFAAQSRETGKIPSRIASVLYNENPLQRTGSIDRPSSTPPTRSTFRSEETTSPDILDMVSDTTRPSTASSRTSTDTAFKGTNQPIVRSKSSTSLTESLTPSVMSEEWHLSPKERLGLGSRIRKSDVLPWEMPEELADYADGLASPGLSEGKRKRLSLRLPKR